MCHFLKSLSASSSSSSFCYDESKLRKNFHAVNFLSFHIKISCFMSVASGVCAFVCVKVSEWLMHKTFLFQVNSLYLCVIYCHEVVASLSQFEFLELTWFISIFRFSQCFILAIKYISFHEISCVGKFNVISIFLKAV